ncbi:MAG: LuxR C-terminal-related transcriptional regulator [Aggregatilineales bacterium]
MELMTTKIRAPSQHKGLVQRSRLYAFLDDAVAQDARLIAVIAPPGFGKTSLVSDWLIRRQFRSAWVAIDAGDNVPLRFWQYVVAALQTIDEVLGVGILQALQSSTESALEIILVSLINRLADYEQHVHLVLDDYHLIRRQEIHTSLTSFLEQLPSNVTCVILSRSDPPLPLARYRARGQMLELRADSLRFTVDEAATFLTDTFALNLNPDHIVKLEERTEGWVAGLQLAALSMRGRDNVESFLKSFTGTHRHIASYLIDEVLAQQSEERQQFLLQTSILDRLTGDLCRAVSGMDDSDRLLDDLYTDNIFLTSLDDYGGWYRYHHLFADVLRQRLMQQMPDSVDRLHGKAARWYVENGFTHPAINHFLAARDVGAAHDLIAEHYWSLLQRGDLITVRGWLGQLPDQIVADSPQLCMAQAWVGAMTSQLPTVETYTAKAEELLSTRDNVPVRLSSELTALQAQRAIFQGNYDRTIEQGESALEHAVAVMRAPIHQAVANAYRMKGQLEPAEFHFTQTYQAATAAGNTLLALYALTGHNAIHEIRGNLHDAWQTQERGFRLLIEQDIQEMALAGVIHLHRGKLLREWNRLDEAESHLNRATDLARIGALEGTIVDSMITLALLYMGRGDFTQAQRHLSEAEIIVTRWGHADTLLRISAFRTRLWVAEGQRMQMVRAWIESARKKIEVDAGEQFEIEQTVITRGELALGNTDAALARLKRCLEVARRAGRGGRVIELLVLLAMAHNGAGEAENAQSTLHEALDMAEQNGYVRVFLDEGAPMRDLLKASDHPYAAQLLRQAVMPSPHTASSVDQSQLIEPLSQRELEVLALVAEGLTDQEIADRLVISRRTVKKHNENIYGKLSVNNRTQAVIRAQDLDLI